MECDRVYTFKFNDMNLSDEVCPKCKSENIFFQQLDFGEDTPKGGVKTGNGGCGGYRR